jgi:class 3 adenylate cyclase
LDKLQIPPDLVKKLEKEGTFINIEREQKKVTVLFIYLTAFSHMFKKHDTETVFAIIDLYFRMLHSIVQKNNGIVNKFIGDSLMAVWGLPVPHANDAYNAVRTAIEMRMGIFHLIPELVRIGTVPLEVGIGIGTSTATCGFIGPSSVRDFTLVGECILKAARLELMASDNRIFIDRTTAEEVRPYSYLISIPHGSRPYILKNEKIYELEGIYELSQEFESVRRYPRVIVAKAVGITKSSTKKRKVGLIRSIGEGGLGIEMHENKDFNLEIGEKIIIDSRHLSLLGTNKINGIVIRKQELQGEGIIYLKKWDIGIKLLELPEKTKKILEKAIVGRTMIKNL